MDNYENDSEEYARYDKSDEREIAQNIEKRNHALANYLSYTNKPSLHAMMVEKLYDLDHYGCLFANNPDGPAELMITTPAIDKPHKTAIDNYYDSNYKSDIAKAVSGEKIQIALSSFTDRINFINFAIYSLRVDLAELAPVIQNHVNKDLQENIPSSGANEPLQKKRVQKKRKP